MHTTNYTNAFVEVADDCRADTGTRPPEKATPTIARLQFDMIYNHPYRYTSDDVLFEIYARRHSVDPADVAVKRAEFFSKGQPCLRSSPLGKTYGWGIHFDEHGHIALYARESDDYRRLSQDGAIRHLKALKQSR